MSLDIEWKHKNFKQRYFIPETQFFFGIFPLNSQKEYDRLLYLYDKNSSKFEFSQFASSNQA